MLSRLAPSLGELRFLEELAEELSALFFPRVSHGFAEVGVFLGTLLEELVLVMAEVGSGQVLSQGRVEHGELRHAVAEADTLLH